MYIIFIYIPFPFSRGSSQSRESNPGLLHCRQIHYQLSHQGSPMYIIMYSKSYIYMLYIYVFFAFQILFLMSYYHMRGWPPALCGSFLFILYVVYFIRSIFYM